MLTVYFIHLEHWGMQPMIITNCGKCITNVELFGIMMKNMNIGRSGIDMKKMLIITIFLVGLFSASIVSLAQQDTLYFPVSHHIITKDDGTGGADASAIPYIMQELNQAFATAKIQFYMSCIGVDTIKNELHHLYFC